MGAWAEGAWAEGAWAGTAWAQAAGNQPPVIVDQIFNALDGATAGQATFQVQATDPEDDTLTYAITAGNTNTDWEINSSTGVLSNLNTLDQGTTSSYSLTISVDEASNDPQTATITINVQSAGTQPPGKILILFR